MGAGSLALACMWLLGQAPSDVFYTNQRNHRLDVDFTNAQRAAIKEVRLYASSTQGRTWDLVSSIPPDKGFFVFNAPGDGTFWLRVASVNQQGVQEPANINVGPPNQKMVIDTAKPIIRALQARRQGNDVVVNWEVQEDNPDVGSFRIEHQPKGALAGLWSAVAAKPGAVGQTSFPASNSQPLVVRLTMRDLAGNESYALAEVGAETVAPVGFNAGFNSGAPAGGMNPGTSNPGSGSNLGGGNTGGANVGGNPAGLPSAGSLDLARDIPIPLGQTASGKLPEPIHPVEAIKPPMALGDPGTTAKSSPAPLGNPLGGPSVVTPPKEERKLIASSKWSAAVTPPTIAPPVGGTEPKPPAAPVPSKQLPPLQYINQLEFMVEYEVSKIGPSGVGSVMLYWTRDDGQTWKEYAYDEKVETPVKGARLQRMMRIPDGEPDGIYGFTLVVKNRANIGRQPPQPGEAPELRIELDTRGPEADLFEPTRDPHPGHLLLRWEAIDKNLTAAPICLEWAEARDGPWRPIGIDLPNTGQFSWKLPEQMPVAVFLRLRVRDLAGNETVAISPTAQPVDLHEPEGHLLRVSVPARQP